MTAQGQNFEYVKYSKYDKEIKAWKDTSIKLATQLKNARKEQFIDKDYIRQFENEIKSTNNKINVYQGGDEKNYIDDMNRMLITELNLTAKQVDAIK